MSSKANKRVIRAEDEATRAVRESQKDVRVLDNHAEHDATQAVIHADEHVVRAMWHTQEVTYESNERALDAVLKSEVITAEASDPNRFTE